MKRNFIFDLDGTLVDSLPGIAFAVNAALPPRRLTVESLKPYIGPPIRSILRSLGQPTCEEDLDRMERVFRHSYDTDGWRATYEFSGATKLLERIRAAGKRVFLVTNKPSKPAGNILRNLGLDACFESVVTPDAQVPPFRGKEEMLRSLVSHHDLRIGDCLMVGDAADDYTAATALGMDSVVVAHGYGHERVAAEFLNCQIVPDLGVISALFIENGGAAL